MIVDPRYVRRVLGLALAVALLGCAEAAVPSPDPGTASVFFPRQPPATGPRAVQTALLDGRLVVQHGCVWLARGAERYLIVWPSSYAPAVADGSLVILGPDNQLLAREGQMLLIGGGEVALEPDEVRRHVEELTGQRAPDACPVELVWKASSIVEAAHR